MPKANERKNYTIKCLIQDCSKCGLKLFKINNLEKTDLGLVTWFKFDKVDFVNNQGKASRYLELMKMTPGK